MPMFLDSGFAPSARPGMTAEVLAKRTRDIEQFQWLMTDQANNRRHRDV
jgi:3-oxoacyl-[acyl-carrier-protein] synthase III